MYPGSYFTGFYFKEYAKEIGVQNLEAVYKLVVCSSTGSQEWYECKKVYCTFVLLEKSI